jgi:uncharacterized protein (TIGR02996 family)
MTEEDTLIRAVLAFRGDVCPRLIYADWLEERGDPRGEYLRLLTVLDGLAEAAEDTEDLRGRLRELESRIDLRWIALMRRGRTRPRSERGQVSGSARKGRRRSRREGLAAAVAIFLQQYARKTKNTPDPNDRRYSRQVEKLVLRMRPEDLDQLTRDGEI